MKGRSVIPSKRRPRELPRAVEAGADELFQGTVRLQREQIRALEDRLTAQEAELRAYRFACQAGFEKHPVPCVELLANGIIREANAGAVELLGGKRVTFTAFRTFLAPESIEPFYRHIQQCVSGPGGSRHIETDVTLNEAGHRRTVRLISARPTKTQESNAWVMATALVDLTELRASAHWHALEDKTFQRLVEFADGIIWEADGEGKLTYAAPQVERLLGYSSERFVKEPGLWLALIHVEDRDRASRHRAKTLQAAGRGEIEYRIHTAQGEMLWFRDSMIVRRDGHGNTQMQGLAVNITPLKAAQDELRRAHAAANAQAEEHKRHLEETVRSMETFCYGIAHELRAPVRTMQGFGELLLREPNHPRLCDYLKRITHAATRMDALIADLLAYGRLHHTNVLMVATTVSSAVERALEGLAEEIKRTKAEVRMAPSNARVKAHPMLLVQALQNLISNGIKFVPKGTTPKVELFACRIGQRTRISVYDNGVGVRPESRDKIFGLFERAHSEDEYPGSGVGLAMVKRIAEMLDGQVGIDFSVQKGSRFWIELPSVPQEATVAAP